MPPTPGAPNEGLRILRVRADDAALHLVAEGRGGRTYVVRARAPRRLANADGVVVVPDAEHETGRSRCCGWRSKVRRELRPARVQRLALGRRLP